MKVRMLGGLNAATTPVPQPASTGIRIAAGVGVLVLMVVAVAAIHKFNAGDNARLVRG